MLSSLPAFGCNNGFFVISCYNFGAPSFCQLGGYSGIDRGAQGFGTTNNCTDCHQMTGYIYVYWGVLDCDGDERDYDGYGCCGIY